MHASRRFTILVSLLAVVAGVVAPSAATASRPLAQRGVGPAITVEPGAVQVDGIVVVTGTGFDDGSVEIFLDSVIPGTALATVAVTRGGFDVRFTAPDAVGKHDVVACRDRINDSCREQASTSLAIESAPPSTTTTTTTSTSTTTTTSTSTTTLPLTDSTTSTAPPTTSPDLTGIVTTTTTGGELAIPPTTVGPFPTAPPNPGNVAIESTTTMPTEAATPEPEAFEDLRIRAIEVTQGIQNLTNRMPLVANRRTIVRVHPETVSGEDWAPIDGLLLLERPGEPDLVLVPENGPIAVNRDRTDWNAALNFILPESHIQPGDLELTAAVWAFNSTTLLDEEPNPDDNLGAVTATFHASTVPLITVAALDDGTGPGPAANTGDLLGFSLFVAFDLSELHPVSGVNISPLPNVIGPGTEAAVAGRWDLAADDDGVDGNDDTDGNSDDDDDIADARRSEPNTRLALVAELAGLLDITEVLGRFDGSIPADGYTGWATAGVSWTKPTAGTPSHELGHTGGLGHVGCKDTDDDGIGDELKGGAIDIHHPTGLPPVCSLAPINEAGYFGMRTYSDPTVIYSNDPTHPNAAFPFMSYASPGWSDPYYYCVLLENYGVPCNGATTGVPKRVIVTVDCDPEPSGQGWGLDLCLIDQLPPPSDPELPPPPGGNQSNGPIPFDPDGPNAPTGAVLLAGQIDRDTGEASLDVVRVVPDASQTLKDAYAAIVERTVVAGEMPNYVVFRDADGTVLMSAPVEVSGEGHGDGAVAGRAVSFLHAMPFPDDTATIELAIDGETRSTHSISEHAPTVTDVTAESDGDTTVVRWSATDSDGDDLVAEVFWSNDGERWVPAASGVASNEVRVPHGVPMPGGDNVRVRVDVTDGSRSARAESPPFSAPTHDAAMVIGGVEADAQIAHLDPVTFHALVADPDQTVFDGDITWHSDVDGELGTGRTLTTRDLSLGRHVVTATADDDGVEVSASIGFDVVPRDRPTRYGETPDELGAAFLLGDGSVDAIAAATGAAVPDDDAGLPVVPLTAGGIVAVLVGLVAWRRPRTAIERG